MSFNVVAVVIMMISLFLNLFNNNIFVSISSIREIIILTFDFGSSSKNSMSLASQEIESTDFSGSDFIISGSESTIRYLLSRRWIMSVVSQCV